jgi:hypothetical protein
MPPPDVTQPLPLSVPSPAPRGPEGPPPPRGRGAHERPNHTFRAIGVFVLVLGAIAGVYVAISHPPRPGSPNELALGVLQLAATPAADADPEHAKAIQLAQQKAAAAAADAAAQAKKANDVAKRNAEAASRSQTRTAPYPVPASCSEYTANRAIGCALLLDAGFGLDQMPCLDKLFTKESGWNPKARNPSSGAYGIPQALPGDKMAPYGSDWQTNPVPQIKWGLAYIKNRYQTPCNAWSHSQSTGWY